MVTNRRSAASSTVVRLMSSNAAPFPASGPNLADAIDRDDLASAPMPAACTSMEEVRAGVDALDRTLVALLAQRQGYMEAAARIKPTANDVRVPWRIEDVVEKVLKTAAEQGLSALIAEPVWRVLIEQCIEHELNAWHAVRETAPKKAT